MTHISSAFKVVIPTPSACCFPSAMIAYLTRHNLIPGATQKFLSLQKNNLTTIVSLGTSAILPPFDVSPGHITFAPLNTNLIAPLSTCSRASMNGSVTNNDSF